MLCPMCAATVPVQRKECDACGVVLTEYAAVWYLPDLLYNEGVAALGGSRYAEAATLFAQVCGLRDDLDARRAWAHACSELGRHEEAVGILYDGLHKLDCPELEEQYARALLALRGEQKGPSPGGPQPVGTEPRGPVRPGAVRAKTSRSSRKRHR